MLRQFVFFFFFGGGGGGGEGQMRCIMGDVQVANRIFSRRIYMKMLFSSQRREILNLFLTTKSVQCSSSHEKFEVRPWSKRH